MDFQIIEQFNCFWTLFAVNETKFPHRRACTLRLWIDMPPERREAIIEDLRRNGAPKDKNPFFFLQEFASKTEPTPTNYQGRAIPSGLQVFSAKWRDKWGMYTLEDIRNFHMQLPQN